MEEKKDGIAIWQNTTKDNRKCWNFTIGSKEYTIYDNEKKEGERKPAFKLYIKDAKGQTVSSKESDLPF